MGCLSNTRRVVSLSDLGGLTGGDSCCCQTPTVYRSGEAVGQDSSLTAFDEHVAGGMAMQDGDTRTEYDRLILYEEVWTEPVKVVAARYGVSDVALAKNCRRLGVPLPGRGYWAKKKAGTAPSRPPLPGLPAGVEDRIPVAPAGRRGPTAAPLAARAAQATIRVQVAETLRRPHTLVASAHELLKGRGPRDELVSCRSKACIDIAVSRASLGRALRIVDALVKAMEGQGYQVEVTEPTRSYWSSGSLTPGVTRVRVGADWIHFALTEKRTTVIETKRTSWGHTWTQREYVFSGVLSLSLTNVYWIDVRKTWNDGKRQRIEDCLGDFVGYLPAVSEKLRARREEEERRARERREAERRREEQEARRQAEERRVKDLLERVRRWKLSQDIRSYVDEAVKASGHEDDDLSWALRYANKLDPLVKTEQSDERPD